MVDQVSDPRGIRMIDYFDRGAAIASGRPCMIDGDKTYSYEEVTASSHQIAQALIKDGFMAGDKAAVLCGNSAIAFKCILGVLRADGTWVTANHRAGLDENSYLLDFLDVDVLFIHSEVADRIETFREKCPNIRRYVMIDREHENADAFLQDWLSQLDDLNTPRRLIGAPEELALLVNTGGTTGLPKGVMITNRSWGAMIASLDSSMPMRKPPVNLVAAPMTHAAGPLALWSMAAGGTVVILPQFTPDLVARAIDQHKVTYLFLPPTAIYMLSSHASVSEYDYSSLEYMHYAGAPMSPDKLQEAIQLFGVVLHGSFGQSEAPMCLTAIRPEEHVDENGKILRPGSCGRPTMHSRVEIMDDDGNILGPGVAGEIVARSPLVMEGYYKNPEATAEVSQFGWHHTGDIGVRDEDGWFTIVDRKKDMIISGGFNVYPAEVETVILAHDCVQDCAVVGIPDEKWGEAVYAEVEVKDGQELDVDELQQFVRHKIGAVKTPKTFKIVKTLPRSNVGKVLRSEVKDKFWDKNERKI